MNQLQHIDEFRTVLANYQLSAAAKTALAKTKLVLLVGPTSTGKNTIISELVQTGKYHYIVSDTTRKPRENNSIMEQDGREYWFRTEEELLADIKAGQFLEAAIIHDQQVSGVSIRELEAAAQEGKIAINEIEVVGADNVHTANPEAIFLFVVPPSFDEWIARMTIRGNLPDDEVRRRLQSAVNEITVALERPYYQFVVNDTYMHAAKRIDDLLNGDILADDQIAAKRVAEEILQDTKQYLAQ